MDATTAAAATLTLTAAELRMGDVVLDEHGDREHAVYDLDVTAAGVTLWTAVPDQELGWPRQYTVPADTTYTVARRAR